MLYEELLQKYPILNSSHKMNRSTPMSWLFLLIKNTEKIEIFHMFAPDQKNIPQKKNRS